MQLICHFTVSDFDRWRSAWDADHEARTQAGLTVLQLWRGPDDGTRAHALLSVNNRAHAQAWIDRSDALSGDDAGTVSDSSYHFVTTA
ncbi:hypothetical protein [Sulfitobacter sp. S190]|uniref:hypothetical protein n=1 Tax=Sulfitobacter sp. S190 TaxID=2867022 RepID=UPI0021A43B80|nr:hypothetical protein [Sulfitobacter sp. S190]UWR21702.1 hypothetical protein K3756_13545 [Sulfitobacter sp. S190]